LSLLDERWAHSRDLLNSTGLFGRITRIVPQPYFSEERHASQIGSNWLGFIECLERARRSRCEWKYIFEDDIGIDRRSDLSDEMSLAEEYARRRRSPLLYGGLCGDVCRGFLCTGACAHAWAVSNASYILQRVIPNETTRAGWGVGTRAVFDRHLMHIALHLGGVPLIGQDHSSPHHFQHHGAFFQDRAHFWPTIPGACGKAGRKGGAKWCAGHLARNESQKSTLVH
jgi:hypothetical protein